MSFAKIVGVGLLALPCILGRAQWTNQTQLTVQSGLTLTVEGGVTNESAGSIDNQGQIDVGGDWMNQAVNGGFSPVAGSVVMSGDNMNIGGANPTNFNNLSFTGNGDATFTTGSVNTVGAVVHNNLSIATEGLALNGRTLKLENGASSALSATSGYISTDEIDGSPNPNYSQLDWNIGSNTGSYMIPFRTASGVLIPLTYDITTSGDASGRLLFSQYEANYLNTPLPDNPLVSDMQINGLNGELTLANRFWRIDASSYTLQPEAGITFKYLTSDLSNNLTGTSFIDEASLVAYAHDNTSSAWGSVYHFGTIDLLQNELAITGVSQSDSWWVLGNACAGFQVDAGTDVTCGGPSVNLNTNATGSTGTVSYSWSPADSLSCNNCQSPITTVNYTNTYTVTASDNRGCVASDDITINIDAVQPAICMVTVDSTSTKNKVVWDKTLLQTTLLDSVFIYRKNVTGVYDKVGAVHVDSLSQYVDNDPSVNPNIRQYDYKISLLDKCGVEGLQSDNHTTIFMKQWFAGSTVDIEWDPYSGFAPGFFYEVYRDTIMDGTNNNWHYINGGAAGAQTPSTVTTINDGTPPTLNVLNNSTRYEVRIAIPGGNCDATKAVSYGSTRSNKQSIASGNPSTITAAFTQTATHIANGNYIVFTDQSIGTPAPTSRIWTFQGGTPNVSTAANPTVQYSSDGVWDVTLVASNGTDSDTLTKSGWIEVGFSGIEGVSSISSVLVFPNPVSDELQVSINSLEQQAITIQLLSVEGKVVVQKMISGSGQIAETFDVSNLESSYYFIKLITDTGTWTKPVVKQ